MFLARGCVQESLTAAGAIGDILATVGMDIGGPVAEDEHRPMNHGPRCGPAYSIANQRTSATMVDGALRFVGDGIVSRTSSLIWVNGRPEHRLTASIMMATTRLVTAVGRIA